MRENAYQRLIYDHPKYLATKILKNGPGHLFYISFSPDGKLVACSGGIKGFNIWETQTQSKLLTLDDVREWSPVFFSPTAKHLAICRAETVEVLDISSHKMINAVSCPSHSSGGIREVLFDKDEQHISVLTCRYVHTSDILDKENAEVYWFFDSEFVLGLRLASRGSVLAYTCRLVKKRYTHLFVTDILSRARVAEVPLDCDRPPVISHDGRLALRPPWGKRNKYQIWDLRREVCVSEFLYPGVISGNGPTPFSSDNKHLVVTESNIWVWAVRTGQLISEVDVGEDLLATTSCSACSKRLGAIWNRGLHDKYEVLFVDALSAKVLGHANGHTTSLPLFSPCGRWFATVSDDNYRVDRSEPHPSGSLVLSDLRPCVEKTTRQRAS